MDKLEYALMIVALGLFVVMFILFLLYILINVFGRVLNRPAQEKKTADCRFEAGTVPAAFTQAPAAGVSPAVAAAALAAVYSMLEPAPGRSFKVTATPQLEQLTGRWALEGRKLLMDGRTQIDLLRRQDKGEKV